MIALSYCLLTASAASARQPQGSELYHFFSHQDDLLSKRRSVFDRAKDGVNKTAPLHRAALNLRAKPGRTARPPKGLPFEDGERIGQPAYCGTSTTEQGVARKTLLLLRTVQPARWRRNDLPRRALATHMLEAGQHCIAALHRKTFPKRSKNDHNAHSWCIGGFLPVLLQQLSPSGGSYLQIHGPRLSDGPFFCSRRLPQYLSIRFGSRDAGGCTKESRSREGPGSDPKRTWRKRVSA